MALPRDRFFPSKDLVLCPGSASEIARLEEEGWVFNGVGFVPTDAVIAAAEAARAEETADEGGEVVDLRTVLEENRRLRADRDALRRAMEIVIREVRDA
jgi:hypothetical protein